MYVYVYICIYVYIHKKVKKYLKISAKSKIC